MYLIAGQTFEAGEHGLERALVAACEGRNRPLCLCSEPPVPVYITRLGGTFVLKRMPFTGSQHAVSCSHHESPAELSGLDEVLGTAISEDPDTGITQLRVGFALSKGAPRSVDTGSGQDTGGVRSNGTRLSLRGLLHFLWHEAGLTRWHPGFVGRRSWAVVRSHLLAAATSKFVHGAPLAEVLYVPEPFTVNDRDEINGRRAHRFATRLSQDRGARPMMILIGEVKEIVPTRFHFKAVVKHVPDLAFLLDSQLHRRMARRFSRELSLWGGSQSICMIVIATFSVNDAGLPMFEELSLVPTTPQWLPVEDSYELQLIDRLVNDGRTFEKSLRFNENLERRCSTSAILLDVQPLPIVLGLDRTAAESSDSCRTEKSAKGGGLPQWLWRIHSSGLPSLPARATRAALASDVQRSATPRHPNANA